MNQGDTTDNRQTPRVLLRIAAAASVVLGSIFASAVSAQPTADALPESATDESVDQQELVSQLIVSLGAPEYWRRKQATEGLRRIGLPAKDQLLKAVDSRDAEVSFRARRLLVVVMAEDFEARVAAFASDSGGQADHDLPGWDRFQELVGDSPAERRLFVEMLRAESLLLEMCEQEPAKLKQILTDRCEQMYKELRERHFVNNKHVTRTFPLGSIAALYFVAAQPDVQIDNNLASKMNQLMHRSTLRQEITTGDNSEALKRLLGAWISASATSSLAYQNLWMALQYDIKEGLEPARHIVRTNQAGSSILPTAIMALAKLGGEQERETLQPLLKEERVVRTYSRGGKKYTCQVRDAALVALIHLDKKKPKEFGFEFIQAYPQTLYQVSSIGFENDTKRAAAFKKWQESKTEKPSESEQESDKAGSAEKEAQ